MIPAISTALIAAWALVLVVAGEGCHPNKPIENEDFRISCDTSHPPGVVTLFCKSEAKGWTNFPKERFNLNGFNVTIAECGFPDDDNFRLLEHINSLGLKEIRKLTFFNVKMPLKSHLLSGISVNTLHIHQSHLITELPDQLLQGMQIQANFWVTKTNLTKVPPGLFLNQGNITHVDLNYNKIERLNRTLFEPLVKLKKLYLNSNRLTEIEDGLFDRQTELEILDLGQNSLKTLPPNIFRNLKSLRLLHVSSNNFTELPAQLLRNQNENLKRFGMDENQGNMKTLPDGFFKNLRKLEEVWMYKNHFTSIPADLFVGAESLEHVDFSSNELTALPSKIFADAPNLRQVKLSNNQLSELPDDLFNENANLEELYLDNNQLTNITEFVLDRLHYLRVLDVSHNSLMFMNLKICDELNNNLNDVNISYNNLTLLGVFTNCVGIQKLFASNNNISKIIVDDIINKHELKTLNLANNRITELPLSAISRARVMQSLSFLDVSRNQITSIDMKNHTEPEDGVKSITVDVSSNPLHCDCHIYDFMHFLETKNADSHFKIMKRNITCAGPPQVAGRSIEEVHSTELTCRVFSNTTGDACSGVCACYENPGNKRLIVDCSNRKLKSVPAMISKPQGWSIALNMSGNELQITPAMNKSYLSEVVALDLSTL